MRRRLRKKKHVGEFRELGCAVRADLHPDLSDEELGEFIDRWIAAVAARKLAFGGGGGRDGRFEGFITHAGRGSVTEEDRLALASILDNDVAVLGPQVSELCDAWL